MIVLCVCVLFFQKKEKECQFLMVLSISLNDWDRVWLRVRRSYEE
jgi:hypothetical protein